MPTLGKRTVHLVPVGHCVLYILTASGGTCAPVPMCEERLHKTTWVYFFCPGAVQAMNVSQVVFLRGGALAAAFEDSGAALGDGHEAPERLQAANLHGRRAAPCGEEETGTASVR